MSTELDPTEQAEAKETSAQHRHDGVVLRVGVTLSTVLMSAGLVVRLVGERATPALRHLLSPSGGVPGRSMMAAGIFALALTPAARIGALLVVWVRERDWRFVAVALAVVATLTTAVLLGRG